MMGPIVTTPFESRDPKTPSTGDAPPHPAHTKSWPLFGRGVDWCDLRSLERRTNSPGRDPGRRGIRIRRKQEDPRIAPRPAMKCVPDHCFLVVTAPSLEPE